MQQAAGIKSLENDRTHKERCEKGIRSLKKRQYIFWIKKDRFYMNTFLWKKE